jgi:hypothetical protein
MEPSTEPGERPEVAVDRRAAQILEQIVVEMNPSRLAWLGQHLVQIGEIVVDEVRKWLRWVHGACPRHGLALCADHRGALILPMVQ